MSWTKAADGFFRCVGDRSDDAEDVAGKRRHHRQPGSRPVQDDLVDRGITCEPDVGQQERLFVLAALEVDAGLVAHLAVDAVGAHHVACPDGVAVVERRRDAVGVLLDGGQRLGPGHGASELDQPV